MKILSINVRGLRGQAKIASLKRLVEVENPDILPIRETMVKGESVILVLEKTFGSWSFFSLNSKGLPIGLITSFNHSVVVENSFACPSTLQMEIF